MAWDESEIAVVREERGGRADMLIMDVVDSSSIAYIVVELVGWANVELRLG